jgi:formylglycine-generating enzyme required for sulfatase activity
VLVKAGSFTMSGKTKVILTNDYYISKYPVTQTQYLAVMGNNPSYFSGDNNPVEQVSWYDANKFAEKVGGRLPTEAEWEFAARGGNKSNGYIYSGSNDIAQIAWYNSNSSSRTQVVGTKFPNELGIYDMSGNVWEWCSDWYGLLPKTAMTMTNPKGPAKGTDRVIRGGSWDNIAYYCRIARVPYGKKSYDPSNLISVGIRVVFSADKIFE